MTGEIQKDRIRGSLIGGAIGDALGYPVEFINSFEGIQKRYGEHGITRLDTTQWWMDKPDGNGKAVLSDDTQLTLYTANGLLNAKSMGAAPVPAVCRAYIEWYLGQIGWADKRFNECWLRNITELNKRRAPGMTCMTALKDIFNGRDGNNNSKGCGGVMRIAPIALYGATLKNDGETRMGSIHTVDQLAANVAEITHRHPLGYMPAALEAHIIYKLMLDEHPSRDLLKEYVAEGLEVVQRLYPQFKMHFDCLQLLMEKAISLANNRISDVKNIPALGKGWVAEETLAIAIYCAVRHFDNFEKAATAAVNHGGDSDSTGAVLGNILGTAVGYEAIPQCFKDNLELHDVILHVADDLWRGEITKYPVHDEGLYRTCGFA